MSLGRRIAWLASLYLVQGLPFGFQAAALPAFLREAGVSLTEIGFLDLLALPWLLKALWSPVVDRFGSSRWGRRRSWILPLQLVLAFAAAAGAAGGPERGAITGFVLGIMFDLSVGSPLGSSAITMGLAGAVAGWVDVIRIDTTWWLAAIGVGVGAGVGEAGVPVVRRFIGEQDAFVPEMWTIIPVVAVAAAIVSIAFVPVARWALKLGRPEWKVLTDA